MGYKFRYLAEFFAVLRIQNHVKGLDARGLEEGVGWGGESFTLFLQSLFGCAEPVSYSPSNEAQLSVAILSFFLISVPRGAEATSALWQVSMRQGHLIYII